MKSLPNFPKVLLILICLLGLTVKAQAQSDLVIVKYDGVSEKAKTPTEAVREVSAQATEKIARDQVLEMVGEAKYRKNLDVINRRIIPQSSKFIPYTRPSQAVQTANGYKVSVELKVSQESLRQMIKSAGLLADTENPGTLISLVSITNKTDELSFKPWAPESSEGKKELAALSQLWQQTISNELEKKKFKLAKPQKQSFDESELISSAQAQMVIRGETRIRTLEDGSGTLAMKAGIYQAADSRLLADVTRSTQLSRVNPTTIKTAANDIFKDVAASLATSVHEAWQTGVIGSSSVQIAAVGALTPKQLDDLKAELNRFVRSLKNLRERKFSSESVVLEADYKGSLSGLAEQLRKTSLPSFQTEVIESSANLIELRVKARR